MRLAMERPSPVELSPPVGLAESRWKRPKSRPTSSGERPGPWSATRTTASSPSRAARDVDPAADRAVFHGVADEIVDRLAEPLRVAADAQARLDRDVASPAPCRRQACGCSPTTSVDEQAEIELVGADRDVDARRPWRRRSGPPPWRSGGAPTGGCARSGRARPSPAAATRRATRSGSRCGRGSRRAGSSGRARRCRAPRP